MPWIIDYEVVLEQMTDRGYRCNYYNSGAFGFADPGIVKAVGWVGPEDSTIRPAVLPLVRRVAEPYAPTLARLCREAWEQHIGGRAWVMPMSHWAYEMDYGSRDWMPALLESIGLDAGMLEGRNNGAAIEFSLEEADRFEHFVGRLLEMLLGSDFEIAFTDKPVLCMIHHHKQLWWQTTDEAVHQGLEKVPGVP